eukprot:COSAG02_NODE_38587_length_427_cov_0.951220_1_plen_31_part_10
MMVARPPVNRRSGLRPRPETHVLMGDHRPYS